MLDSSLFRKFLLGFFPLAVGSGKDSLAVSEAAKIESPRRILWTLFPAFARTAVGLSLLDRTTQLMIIGFQLPSAGILLR
jgi:hypothetical protein